MSAVLKQTITVDEFLAWAEAREGRYELEAGAVVAMAPERSLHLETKGEVLACLRDATRLAGRECRALPDGATVRIDAATVYEPDALVYCGPRLPADAIEVPEPIIVVEVLSPGTAYRDLTTKLSGYFTVPSLRHYLIVDADRRTVTHHWRGEAGAIVMRQHRDGDLVLDPPGLTVPVEAMLPARPSP